MFCKNCGRNIGDVQKDLCDECEAILNTNVMTNDTVEVIKEVGNNNSNTSNENSTNNNYTQNTNNGATVNVNREQKSKVVAGVLGILLGALGVHNFYLGYTGKAVAQVLLTILSCGTLSIVSEIWGFIEGILILSGEISTDANGVPLKE